MVSVLPRRWNKMFIIEIGPGIPYPQKKERWRRYGEPLSRLFDPYFLGDKHVQWFRDDSGSFLAGVNVACFESSSKWKESQNEQKDIELFTSLFTPVHDLFIRLGSWAAITGLLDIEGTSMDLLVEAEKAELSGGRSIFSGQLPVEFDEPDVKRQMNMIRHNEKYYIVYTGKQTGCKRYRELSKEQAVEIAKADANQFWQGINETSELS